MKPTKKSLLLTEEISKKIDNLTFHHHYHLLYDIAETFGDKQINYLEIGCYGGGSASLLLQRPNTNVVSIDLGKPINSSIAINNVNKLNKLSNNFTYLEGNSQTDEMVNRVKSIFNNVHILFIDGDHSFNGVINDFKLYKDFVKSGGYIVFDDYLDFKHSPNVKKAVDSLINDIKTEYEIIGNVENTFNARPSSFKLNNTFIIKKI
jgi:cephalosporin hydroxylase